MASLFVEQDDLVLALLAGARDASPLAAFMQRLLTKAQASRGLLLLSPAGSDIGERPEVLQFAAPRAKADAPLDISRLMELGLHPIGSLRPDRIYAVDEMLDYDQPEILARQREALAVMGIRFGRWLRIVPGGETEAWILLTRETEDFSSAAVAAFSSTVPYLKAALRLLGTLGEERMHRAMAQTALERLGIGQIALDHNGMVLHADALAESVLPFVTMRGGRRLQLPPSANDAMVRACRQFSASADPDPSSVCIALNDELALLLRPAAGETPAGVRRAASVGFVRLERREDVPSGARCLRVLHQLSPSEAALAELLSRGSTIAEAGRELNLTEETARNYSKRIYARTGTRGQADLVRIVLGGLAPLA